MNDYALELLTIVQKKATRSLHLFNQAEYQPALGEICWAIDRSLMIAQLADPSNQFKETPAFALHEQAQLTDLSFSASQRDDLRYLAQVYLRIFVASPSPDDFHPVPDSTYDTKLDNPDNAQRVFYLAQQMYVWIDRQIQLRYLGSTNAH